jgi:DMSO reductase anchor subunit
MRPWVSYPVPRSAYFRLMEHQRKIKVPSYEPDIPLILFISFSRVSAGLSMLSVFFADSLLWTSIALGFMVVATLASISHLSAPLLFFTMVRNSRSFVVWEIRLAGALTTFLGLQCLSGWGWFQGLRPLFPWINFSLSLLFLISTGWAYRFETHPAWRTTILPVYYLLSAWMIGLALRSTGSPIHPASPVYALLLAGQGVCLVLYRKHLSLTSPTSLKKVVTEKEKWLFLAFLWTALLLPALVTFALFFEDHWNGYHFVLAGSCLAGIFLERTLFFLVERPVYFLSFIENPQANGKDPFWIRG